MRGLGPKSNMRNRSYIDPEYIIRDIAEHQSLFGSEMAAHNPHGPEFIYDDSIFYSINGVML